MEPTTLVGEGFTLRPLVDDDADEVVAACTDAETTRFLTELPRPYTREHALHWIRTTAPASWTAGGATFAVTDAGSGRLIGSVGLNDVRLGGRAASVGYWVSPWARGRGVATEATRTLAAWAHEQGMERLELTTALANVASQRVALGAGFRHEGLRRRSGKSSGTALDDRAVWVRFADDPHEPIKRQLPDLPGGVLTDGTVTLRPIAPPDADDLHRLRTLPDVIARSFSTLLTRADTTERCEQAAYQWLSGARASFTVRDAATDAFAGDLGMFHLDPSGQAMIGYSMCTEWRGRGYATRAVQLVADWAFHQAGLQRLVAGTAPDNAASQRVLEKAGFQREGYERGRLPDPSGGPRIDNVAFARLQPPLPQPPPL